MPQAKRPSGLIVPAALASSSRLEEPPAEIYKVKRIPKRMIVDTDNHYEIPDKAWQEAKLEFAQDVKADGWFNLGDHYDFHFLSRFEKDPYRGYITIQKEFDSSRGYWDTVSDLVDEAHYILGNHEKRLAKLIELNPAFFGLRKIEDFKSLADLPDNITVYPYGSHVKIGNVWGEHGDQIKSEANPCKWALDQRNGLVRVFGHYHRASSISKTCLDDNGEEITREAYNVGHGTDGRYHKYAGTVRNWQMGFLYVEHYTIAGKQHAQVHHIKGKDSSFCFNGKVYGPRRSRMRNRR